MHKRSVVGIYETMAQAEEAVHKLNQEGFPAQQISVVTQNLTGNRVMHGHIKPEDDLSPHGAATGAWVGGLMGLLLGTAFFWIPGYGPLLVVGRLAALLLAGVEGTLAGATAGALLSALKNWGVAEEHIFDYEKQVQGGKHLVIAHGTAEEVEKAHAILQGSNAGALRVHASTSV